MNDNAASQTRATESKVTKPEPDDHKEKPSPSGATSKPSRGRKPLFRV